MSNILFFNQDSEYGIIEAIKMVRKIRGKQKMASKYFDPYANILTKNNYHADELISGLQKLIRRGEIKPAAAVAYELYITSLQLEEMLWKRLLVISVEDVGMGNPQAAMMVHHLFEMRKNFTYPYGDRAMFFIHAIRYLCESEKDRSSDHLLNIIKKESENGLAIELPDYVYDMHTRKGQEMGRDIWHFLEEASIVIPQASVSNNYKEELIKLYKAKDEE